VFQNYLFLKSKKSTISKLVKEITQLKVQNKDTSVEETQIDQLVYQLYVLTAEEITIIENSIK
jgi:adenine-specific DNA-methyltransferase